MRIAYRLALVSCLVLSCGPSGDPDSDAGVPSIELDMCPPAPDCDDGIACTDDEVVRVDGCADSCVHTPRCESGDGCCAPGCGADEDDDCVAECGNGVVEGDELCDGDCPETELDCAVDGCAVRWLVGSAENCDAQCVASLAEEDRCIDGDGCCPLNCSDSHDSDCDNPGGGLGDPCDDAHQCAAPNGREPLCFWSDVPPDDAPTQCTHTCEADSECGPGAGCQQGACVEFCLSDDECDEGWFCSRPSSSDVFRCMYEPWNPRGATTGSACSKNTDCLGANPYRPGLCMDDDWGFPNGYCTWGWSCGVDNPGCRDDDVCIAELCWESCTTNADCRPQYACYDYFDVGTNICAPEGGDLIGSPCAEDDDCRGGRWEPVCVSPEAGGYCSTLCRTDAECPGDTYCEGNICRAGCATDADCETNFVCTSYLGKSTCLPVRSGNAPLGAACESSEDCDGQGGTADCLGGLASDGYCVRYGCDADADCGTDGACIDQTCYRACTGDEDCAENTVCVSEGDKMVCTIGGAGAGGVGDVCDEHDDCDGVCLEDPNFYQGMCSAICGSASDCPDGSHCVAYRNYGLCFETCQGFGAACERADLVCRNLDGGGLLECAPGGYADGATGAPCRGHWECSGVNAFCNLNFTNGYCTAECGSDADCGEAGACLQSGDTNYCWQRCESQFDCRFRQSCVDVGGGLAVCY